MHSSENVIMLMTFNAELCNYTLSFVHAVNHLESAQTRAIITYVQRLFDHPEHIYLGFSWSGDDASHRFLKKREPKLQSEGSMISHQISYTTKVM